MVHYKLPPQRIDFQPSTLWALNSINSVGVGAGPAAAGVSTFDLVNRVTRRAHRLAVYAAGASKGPPKMSVSATIYSWSEYAYFKTTKPVSFKDFDGATVAIDDASLIYDWTVVSFPFAEPIKISGWALAVPGVSSMGGPAEVLYSDGKPLGDVTFEIQINIPINPFELKYRIVQQNDQTVYRIPSDLLFDFNEYDLKLKTHRRAQEILMMIGSELSNTAPEFNFLVVGHTDSMGTAHYNKQLSKKRAETVAKWLIDHAYVKPDRLKTEGRGFD